MKKVFAFALAVMTALFSMIPVLAAETDIDVASTGASTGASYSVVSAVVNKTYDFKEDFHDSYPYDEDFYTEGVLKLDDYNGDVTLTLKNDSTGETFVYEKEADAEWSVKASVDYLLYETAQIDAVVHIYDLGGSYGIQDQDIPVKITVESSQYSADFHKYPSYRYAYTSMTENEHYTVDYDASTRKAKLTILKIPHWFSLELYNIETKDVEEFEFEEADFSYDTEVIVEDFDPTQEAYWFHIPFTLTMDDGYEFPFTLSVDGRAVNVVPTVAPAETSDDDKKEAPTTDEKTAVATKDSVKATPDSGKATPDAASGKAVKTGDSVRAFFLGGACLFMGAAMFILFGRKRKTSL